jgi:hypothetical protein
MLSASSVRAERIKTSENEPNLVEYLFVVDIYIFVLSFEILNNFLPIIVDL